MVRFISHVSKTMDGDLPPNSNVTFVTFSAAAFITLIPVGTDPVKANLSNKCP